MYIKNIIASRQLNWNQTESKLTGRMRKALKKREKQLIRFDVSEGICGSANSLELVYVYKQEDDGKAITFY